MFRRARRVPAVPVQPSRPLTEKELLEVGVEAVVYGFPLVIVDVTKQVQTNVEEPNHNGHAPINQFSNFLKYPTAAYKDVVRMNVDTLYSFAWLDLSKEPIILSVPHRNFSLTLRMYWPKESALEGSWHPPAVKLAK